MLKLNVEKAPRKPRAKKPASPATHYTLAPADPCPFAAVSDRHAQIEAALTRLVNPPVLVCASNRTIGTVDWTVALYSDDSVRIVTDDAPVALGRFVASTAPTPFGYSIDARIVDVSPVDVLSADVLQSLTNDLTFFAMRAGRFSGKVG